MSDDLLPDSNPMRDQSSEYKTDQSIDMSYDVFGRSGGLSASPASKRACLYQNLIEVNHQPYSNRYSKLPLSYIVPR